MADKKISIFVEAVIKGAKAKLAEVERSLGKMGTASTRSAAVMDASSSAWLGYVQKMEAGTKKSTRTITQEMGKLEQAGKVLEGALKQLAVLAVAYLTKMATQSIVQLSRMAAKNIDLADSYEALSARYGLASDDLLAALDRAAKGTVDKYSTMIMANKALRLGVATTIEEFEQLMKIAMVRAKEFGITTTQAFDTIVTAIGRVSPWMASNVGIIIEASALYDEYGRSIGKAASDLTELEKREALRNRILREGIPDMEAWNEMGVTAATVFEQYDAVMVELRQELSERFLPAVLEVTIALKDLVTVVNKMQDPLKREQEVFAELVEATGSVDAAIKQYAESVRLSSSYILTQAQALEVAERAALDYRIALIGIDAGIREDVIAMRLGSKALIDLGDDTKDLGVDYEDLRKKAQASASAQMDYHRDVAREGQRFADRMSDLSFRHTQAAENAARRRYEIELSSQRSVEDLWERARLDNLRRMENYHAAIQRSKRDHLDELRDMEWDYQNEVRDLIKRAPWWIRQALQKEFRERERIAATGDKKALRQYDESLRERIRQIDPVYAKELDRLQEHYDHQRKVERREHRQNLGDREQDLELQKRQQERSLESQLRTLERNLQDRIDSWEFANQQRLENQQRALDNLQRDHSQALSRLQASLNEKLANINRNYEHWGWVHGTSYISKLNEALAAMDPSVAAALGRGAFMPSLPSFQRGIDYVPSAMPALLHKGEMVVPAGPAEQMREGGGLSITIENLNIGAGVSLASARQLAEAVGEELGRGIRHGHR